MLLKDDQSDESINISEEKMENNEEENLKFTCLVCNFKTKDKPEMDKHVQTSHASQEPDVKFVCGKCDHEFLSKDDFNTHIEIHDNLNEHVPTSSQISAPSGLDDKMVINLYSCFDCSFTFQELPDLNSHTALKQSFEIQIGIPVTNLVINNDQLKHFLIYEYKRKRILGIDFSLKTFRDFSLQAFTIFAMVESGLNIHLTRPFLNIPIWYVYTTKDV